MLPCSKQKAAQAELDEAKNGDRIELREEIPRAALQQAEQQLIELKVQQQDLQVKSSGLTAKWGLFLRKWVSFLMPIAH